MKIGVARWLYSPGWGIQGQWDSWMSNPSFSSILFMTFLGALGIYVLFQKNLLPEELARVVARAYFWPTIPITLSYYKWITPIDDVVLLGVAPLNIIGLPAHLQTAGVKGVVNMCDEYEGPVEEYKRRGIRQLRLRTVDQFEPSTSNLVKGVRWINEFKKKGERVYIHCKAGHGRSSALVMAWLMTQGMGPKEEVQQDLVKALLLRKRNVKRYLYTQQNIREFELLMNSSKVW